MGGGPVLNCGTLSDKVNYKGKMHIIDASRTEVISHSNKRDGDHVKVKKSHRKNDGMDMFGGLGGGGAITGLLGKKSGLLG